MTTFKVLLFNMGIWDGQEPQVILTASAIQAAERVCGETLLKEGTLGKLRAEVWTTGKADRKEIFYSK